jgi:hypothetical protein
MTTTPQQQLFQRLFDDKGFDTSGCLAKFNGLSKLQLFELYRLYRIQWSRWCPSAYTTRTDWLNEKWQFSEPLKRPSDYQSREELIAELIKELQSLLDHYAYDGTLVMISDFVFDTFRIYGELGRDDGEEE